MPSRLDSVVMQVEAVLFASGKPLSVAELTEAIGSSDFRPVQRALRTLQATYDNRQTALEVRRVGDRYALQLREAFVPTVQSVTPVEMAPRTVKTLTLIAYHQPILQSNLVRMTGDSAYEEVQRLRGMGLIRTEPKGSTLELTTSRRFSEYFGIATTKVEDIRRFLEGKLGIPPAAPPPIAADLPSAVDAAEESDGSGAPVPPDGSSAPVGAAPSPAPPAA